MIRYDGDGFRLYPFKCDMLMYARRALDAAKMVEDIGVRSTIRIEEIKA